MPQIGYIEPDTLAADRGYCRRAKFYHLECTSTDDHVFLSGLVSKKTRTVLEIPAGSGRNLSVWQQHGNCRVTVADIEPAMVAQLTARIDGSPHLKHIRPIVADITKLEGSLWGTTPQPYLFDLIVVPQEAFQLIATQNDAGQILSGLSSLLTDEGRLMVDLALLDKKAAPPFPPYYSPALPDGVEIHESSIPIEPGVTLRRARSQYHLGGRIRFLLKYELVGPDGIRDSWISEMTLNNFLIDEFRMIAASAKLSLLGVYSDYTTRPHDGKASRSVFLLKKRTP
jgi:hypothetical protein